MREEAGQSSWARFLNGLRSIVLFFARARKGFNEKLAKRYSSRAVGFCAAAISGLLLIIMLFVPPFLGVADDGSLSAVMHGSGLDFFDREVRELYNNYYVRQYRLTEPSGSFVSSQAVFLSLAKGLDYLFTRDSVFDTRFLALIYGALYLPAVGLVVTQAANRVQFPSEGIVIGVFGVILFADVSYVTYFNSLYPEALWLICLLYCAGFAMALQKSPKWDAAYLLGFAASGLVLCFVEKHCAVLGIFLALFCLKQMRLRDARMQAKVLAVLLSVVLLGGSFYSYFTVSSRFTESSKLHAMTRGVLLESTNPEKSLAEFGIASSYEMLTDISAYDYYPLTEAANPALESGFYDHYTMLDLGLYYARHPGSMISMLDIAVKASFNVRREFCGNYEESVGMPPMGKSAFFSFSSNFKVRSAPKTIGYLLFLVIVFIAVLSRRMVRGEPRSRFRTVALDTLEMLTLLAVLHAVGIILASGDAELTRYGLIMSVCVDLLTYFVFSEILHRLNVLETGEESWRKTP